ncbi:phosphate-starvation-inducible PsiE family protein [Mucilaginibacter sp. X5P1]|uniref:phosphate-starvation-inducible PsiE family protein n=1 Tax=Mucilaginibacter sp. X5P1 TaxID=2723088 RepID=UPI00161A337F|nr:phosphate-starvation-inducible PsiE family protein [Mucilaginibacter sp. X5P1]MBB6140397.1 uncharacterized membrane protein (DUF373 family) [Mucilaginibacter sp. X5P1]
MDNLLKQFEKYISYVLMLLAMIFVCYQVWDLIYHFVLKIAGNIEHNTIGLEEPGKPVAGIFFSILLTLEIIQTIKVFSQDHSVKLKIIIIVGLIAVTRKILLLEVDDIDPMAEFSIAAMVIALSLGYYLVSRSGNSDA